MLPRIGRLLALCVLVGWAAPARAHDPSLSGIRILYRRNDAVVNVTTHLSRLRRAEGRGDAPMTPGEIDGAVRRRLRVRFDGRDFVPARSNVISDNAADFLSWQTVTPTPVGNCEVLARLYPEDPQSRTVVSVLRDGQVVQETLLDADNADFLRSQPPLRPGVVAGRFLREGVLHILTGPDHILFVLGLLLLGGSLKSLLRTITAFTLAHSLTLSLAATGVVHPSPRIVEPLIALSIVAIAVENLRTRNNRPSSSGPRRDLRPLYAFGFGLIHGFGFAGALAEVGLPRAALGISLASFNGGVELGQAFIVLLAFPLLSWLARHRPRPFGRLTFAGSLAIGLIGAFWFVTRLAPS